MENAHFTGFLSLSFLLIPKMDVLFALELLKYYLILITRKCLLFFVGISETGSQNVTCVPSEVHTNIAIVDLNPDVITPEDFCKRLALVCICFTLS